MIINHLKAVGFQDRDIDCNLGPATLITGEPFSGKTEHLYALLAGAYGYIPALGSSNGATFQLASDPRELFVRLSFSDGRENTLALSRDDKGALSKTLVPGVEIPQVMMDHEEYFGLTGQKRLAYILRRANLNKAGYDEGLLLEELEGGKGESAALDAATKKWMKEVNESIAQRDKTKAGVALWMDSLLARLKVGEKNAKAKLELNESIVALFGSSGMDKTRKACPTCSAHWKKVEQANKDIPSLEAEIKVLKHMQETLTEEQCALAGKVMPGLLKATRPFTEDLLRAPLEYHNEQIGMWRGKSWVSHEVFSGTEKLIAYAGLQVALCQDSPCRIVIFDEFGRMPDGWKVRVARRMLDLIHDDVIDQWVVLDCSDSWAKGFSKITTICTED